jgi:hypothetical protein
MHRDVLGEEFEEKQRTLVGPVQIVEDEQKRSLPSRAMKERADGISHMESNRVIIGNGRTLEVEPLAQLRQHEADVPGARLKESPYLVGRLCLGQRPENFGPRSVRRRPFAVTASAPEDAHSSSSSRGREFLSERRLTDSCLTGSQHDLSASAERAIKRMAQLCQFAFAIEDKAALRSVR